MRLSGKRAVVTGGSSGIGRAVAIELAKQGARVAINYRRSRDAAQECVAEIKALGFEGATFQADVADPAQVSSLINDATDYLGGIDLWANVAGADILTGSGASRVTMTICDRCLAIHTELGCSEGFARVCYHFRSSPAPDVDRRQPPAGFRREPPTFASLGWERGKRYRSFPQRRACRDGRYAVRPRVAR